MTDDKKGDIFSLLSGRRAAQKDPSAFEGNAAGAPGATASETHVAENLSARTRPEVSTVPEATDAHAVSSSADPVSSGTLPPSAGREIRATFIIKEAFNDAMRDLAWYERKKIKDILNEALEAYLAQNHDKLNVIGKLKQTGSVQKFS